MRSLILASVLSTMYASVVYGDNLIELPTPSGQLILKSDGWFSSTLEVNGVLYDLAGSANFINVDDIEGLREIFPFSYLIQINSGGTACPAMFMWVNAQNDPAWISDRFGSCSDGFEHIKFDGQAVTFEQRSTGVDGRVAFSYTGTEVIEKVIGLETVDSDLNPYDPMSWIGRSGYEYVSASENENMLLSIMPWEYVVELRHAIRVSSGGFEMGDDGWISTLGCRPTMCNSGMAVVSILEETGRPYIAIKDFRKDKWEFFGEVSGPIPLAMRQAISSFGVTK